MQFIVISHQLLECLWALLLGAILGLFYDLLRFIRRLISGILERSVFLNVTDLFYMLFCAVSYCIFLYSASNGRFRLFTLIALVFGFALYRALPGRFIHRALLSVADFARTLVRWIAYPAVCLFRFIKKGIATVLSALLRRIRIIKTDRIRKQLHRDVRI